MPTKKPQGLRPVEKFSLPNYEIQVLTEDPSIINEWETYSKFFDNSYAAQSPVPVVKVGHDSVKNLTSLATEGPVNYFNPENIDQLLKSLYGKDHMVFVNPKNKNCDKKKKYKLKSLDKLSSDDIDGLVDNILDLLDKKETSPCPCSKPNNNIINNTIGPKPMATTKNPRNSYRNENNLPFGFPGSNGIFDPRRKSKRSCNKDSYLFYLNNENNSLNYVLSKILPITKNIFGKI